MSTLRTCLNYLDAYGIRYAHTTHSPAFTAEQVAAAEYMPAHCMSKAVVLRDNNGYIMAVVPSDANVDIEQVREAVGAQDLYLATEHDLFLLFPGSELGAMPPLGNLFGIPVYLDREVADQEFIAFSAGTHRDVIHMRTSDFIHLVRPVLGDFCTPKFQFAPASV